MGRSEWSGEGASGEGAVAVSLQAGAVLGKAVRRERGDAGGAAEEWASSLAAAVPFTSRAEELAQRLGVRLPSPSLPIQLQSWAGPCR